MARDFNSKHKAKDPLEEVDDTAPGFLPDPSTYMQPTPGGKRRARTFSQTIADATRGVDAGMNRYTKPGEDLSSDNYMPDWRGHYEKPDPVPAPRRSLQLQTMPTSEIKPLTVAERVAMGQAGVGKFDPDEARDQAGKWTAAGAAEFVAARDRSARAAYLSTHTPEELGDHRLFLGYGGKVGYALDKDGDLQNVFNNGGPKGAGQKALVDAIKHGATTLDAYDPYLPSLYSRFGFVPTGRLAFNDEYAPAGWDYKANGRPDVVLMTWKGGDRDTIEQRIGTFPEYKPGAAPLFADYDAAKAVQRSAGVDKRSHAGGGADGGQSGPALWRERFSGTLEIAQGPIGLPARVLKDFNPDEARDDHGRWTEGGGGVAAGDVGQGELKLDHRVIGVGGDEWNQKTAVRLEREYQAAKPKLEKLLTEGLDEKIETKITRPTLQTWGDLDSQKQSDIEDDYVSSTWHSEYDYQVDYWRENDAPGEVGQQMSTDNSGSHHYDDDWMREAIKDHLEMREEEGWPKIPFTLDDLHRSIVVSDEGGISFDNGALDKPEGFDASDPLPGIVREAPEDRLTIPMREDLHEAITEAYKEEFDKRVSDMDAPHYLEEQAKESTREGWDSMDDNDKFNWAKNNNHIDPDEKGSKPKESFEQMELPHTFRPVSANPSLMSEVEDYRKTSGVAHYLSQERAYELVQERLNNPGITRNDVTAADRRIWNSWVDSSSSTRAVEFQAAAAEELGGRFRPPQEGGQNLKDIEAIKKAANDDFKGVGGWEGLKAYTRAKWETTQYLLDKADIPHLQLYRGIMLDDATVKDLPVEEVETKPIEIGGGYTSTTTYKRLPTLSIVRNGAASTSASAGVANSWNGIGVSHDFPRRRVILRAEVPRTAAISVPSYGQNLQQEQEVVVLGTAWKKWDAWKDSAPEFDKIAIAKRIAGVTRRGPELTIDLLAYEAGNNLPNWLSPKGRGVAKGNPNHLGPGPGGGQFASAPGGGTEASALFDAHRDPNVTAQAILDRAPAGVRARIGQVETLLEHTKPTDGQLGDGGFKRPDGTWDDERAAVHERILRGLFNPEAVRNATPAPGEKPTATFLGGRGGSGKSWFTGKNGPVDPGKAIYINSDDLMEELPGYRGWNAAHYHEEASDILTQAEGIGRRQGLNMIFDATMRSGATTAQRVAQLQTAGYDIKGYYMFTSPQEAAQRAVSRFAEQGRYVRPSYVLGSTTNERTFDNLKPSFSDWAIYDNNTPGGSPKLVARKTP